MKKLKTQKGITLIALIITIVVLLILAVVSIGAVKDSNIVGYAQNAAGKYEEGKGIENNTITGYENILAQYSNGGNSLGSSEENNGAGNSGGNNDGEDSGESNTPPNQSINYLGKYVKYDSNGDGSVADETILWRVLRDDADKVELITADTLGNLDLTPTDFNDARNKYNNAVDLMVAECVRVTGISNVRCAGGLTIDTIETIDFEEVDRSTEFNLTVDRSNFSQYEGENGLKVGDNNYQEDYNQMQIAGIVQADNSQEYWLASRTMKIGGMGNTYLEFDVRCGGGSNLYSKKLCLIYNSAVSTHMYYIGGEICSYGVRPVLTLEGGILEGKTGAGTKAQPIEIY